MITMGGYALPTKTIREMITTSVNVIIQAARLRDGSRRITHVTEVMGMEGDVAITQDLFVYDILGEDAQGKLKGQHRSTGIGRPNWTGRHVQRGKTSRRRPGRIRNHRNAHFALKTNRIDEERREWHGQPISHRRMSGG